MKQPQKPPLPREPLSLQMKLSIDSHVIIELCRLLAVVLCSVSIVVQIDGFRLRTTPPVPEVTTQDHPNAPTLAEQATDTLLPQPETQN